MISVDDKALVGQRQGALLAVKAILMPGVALVIHHVGAVAEPCGDIRQSAVQSGQEAKFRLVFEKVFGVKVWHRLF